MNAIGPIIIIIEAIWIFVLIVRCKVLKTAYDRMTGYLAGIINNKSLVDESVTTVALAYGLTSEELYSKLENKNESE